MRVELNAIFDGKVLLPEEDVDLKPNTRVRVIIESTEPEEKKSLSFLNTALRLNLDGPYDWSARLEEYLYGEITDAKK
jgi:hypothetical protein